LALGWLCWVLLLDFPKNSVLVAGMENSNSRGGWIIWSRGGLICNIVSLECTLKEAVV
jgi:hypothetical protein